MAVEESGFSSEILDFGHKQLQAALWMDAILHNLRNHGMIRFPVKIPRNGMASTVGSFRATGFRPQTATIGSLLTA